MQPPGTSTFYLHWPRLGRPYTAALPQTTAASANPHRHPCMENHGKRRTTTALTLGIIGATLPKKGRTPAGDKGAHSCRLVAATAAHHIPHRILPGMRQENRRCKATPTCLRRSRHLPSSLRATFHHSQGPLPSAAHAFPDGGWEERGVWGWWQLRIGGATRVTHSGAMWGLFCH